MKYEMIDIPLDNLNKYERFKKNNPEKYKAIRKRNYEKYKNINKLKRQKYISNNWPQSQFGLTKRNAEVNAKQRKVPFNITTKDLHELYNSQNKVCAISGLNFKRTMRGGPSLYTISLDRIVPSLGYVKGNLRFILQGLNGLKNDGTDEDVYLIIKAVAKRLGMIET